MFSLKVYRLGLREFLKPFKLILAFMQAMLKLELLELLSYIKELKNNYLKGVNKKVLIIKLFNCLNKLKNKLKNK